jgi:hypothetical protein
LSVCYALVKYSPRFFHLMFADEGSCEGEDGRTGFYSCFFFRLFPLQAGEDSELMCSKYLLLGSKPQTPSFVG